MDCCRVKNKKVKKCVRNDGKIFTLPRKFSKKKCLQGPIRGFSMSSSCAPYKFCIKKGGYKKVNILGSKLKLCSFKPLTGYQRNGFCDSGPEDFGKHLVCAKMTPKFLEFTKKKGNDLSSVVNPGDKWCLCENRWLEAYENRITVPVIKKATSQKVNLKIQKKIKNTSSKKKKKNKNNKGKNKFDFP